MRAIDDFFGFVPCKPEACAIDLFEAGKNKVRQLSHSFASTKTLHSCIEDLPEAPIWKMQEVSIIRYETTKPVVVFYRDPLECVQALLQNPIFESKWNFTPRWVYEDLSWEN
jgi:hypothetical protein